MPLTSCLTGLDQSVLQIKTKYISCHTADSKPIKQEVNSTVILPLFSIPCPNLLGSIHSAHSLIFLQPCIVILCRSENSQHSSSSQRQTLTSNGSFTHESHRHEESHSSKKVSVSKGMVIRTSSLLSNSQVRPAQRTF